MFAHVNAVDSGVSELDAEAGGAVKLDVVVARGVDEEDFAGDGVDDGDNIGVGAGGSVLDGGAGVGARDVDDDGRGAEVDFFFFGFIRLLFASFFFGCALNKIREGAVVAEEHEGRGGDENESDDGGDEDGALGGLVFFFDFGGFFRFRFRFF